MDNDRIRDQLIEAREEIAGKKELMYETATVLAKYLKENASTMKQDDINTFQQQIYNMLAG